MNSQWEIEKERYSEKKKVEQKIFKKCHTEKGSSQNTCERSQIHKQEL